MLKQIYCNLIIFILLLIWATPSLSTSQDNYETIVIINSSSYNENIYDVFLKTFYHQLTQCSKKYNIIEYYLNSDLEYNDFNYFNKYNTDFLYFINQNQPNFIIGLGDMSTELIIKNRHIYKKDPIIFGLFTYKSDKFYNQNNNDSKIKITSIYFDFDRLLKITSNANYFFSDIYLIIEPQNYSGISLKGRYSYSYYVELFSKFSNLKIIKKEVLTDIDLIKVLQEINNNQPGLVIYLNHFLKSNGLNTVDRKEILSMAQKYNTRHLEVSDALHDISHNISIIIDRDPNILSEYVIEIMASQPYHLLIPNYIYLNYNRVMKLDREGIYLYNKPYIDFTYYFDYYGK